MISMLLSVPLATLCRNLDLPFPAEILTGNGSRAIDDILHRTLCDQFSSVDPGLRTYINDMIRSIHGILVVFHHDERIADVSQPAKCLQQFFIVLLVQSDTGFVQNVKNAHQP